MTSRRYPRIELCVRTLPASKSPWRSLAPVARTRYCASVFWTGAPHLTAQPTAEYRPPVLSGSIGRIAFASTSRLGVTRSPSSLEMI